MSIIENLSAIHQTIPEGVKLLCVSKFHPSDMIREAYSAGERCFGESRPQELVQKTKELPEDIEWHYIGNLQTNKVKMIVPQTSLIHSMANTRLFDEVEKEAAKRGKVQDVLIELHVAGEETKSGFSPEEAIKTITREYVNTHPHVRICGVMGMATLTDDAERIRGEFVRIRDTFNNLKATVFADCEWFSEISMGMSDDYPIALEEGATIIRVGSKIFGVRQY